VPLKIIHTQTEGSNSWGPEDPPTREGTPAEQGKFHQAKPVPKKNPV